MLLGGILTAAVLEGRCRRGATAALHRHQPELPRSPASREASGVAISRRTPGIIWSHNDSARASLFAFENAGNTKGRVG